jgi:CBS-domain-containing membrane protein
MNNTFTTGIFFLIVLVKRLAWTYSAECIAILAVEIAVAMLVFLRPVHTPADALVLVGLFPASLVLVAVLEKYAGWN